MGRLHEAEWRRAPWTAGLATVLALTGGGTVSASVLHGTVRQGTARQGAVRPATAAGTLSTIAGGIGGPGVASQISLTDGAGVLYNGGHLYLSTTYSGELGTSYPGGDALRQIDPATDELTTVAGNGATVYAGNGSLATKASLGAGQVAVDPAGNLVTYDALSLRLRVIAARTGTFYGQAMTAGHIYSIAGTGTSGTGGLGGLGTKAPLAGGGVATDAAGNVVLGDGPQVVVVAGSTGTFYGKAMTTGHIYRIAGTGTAGYSGNQGVATSAKVSSATGVTVDANGNVVFTDGGNNRIRVIAQSTGTFYGQAMTKGDIYAIAGNGTTGDSDGVPALNTGLDAPGGLTLDSAGNVLVADTGHYEVRVIAEQTGTFYGQAMTKGDIYLLAGTGAEQEAGPFGGAATAASVSSPTGVTVDANGNVVISDDVPSGDDPPNDYPALIVAESTGTFYGQAMTPGDLYAIAGTGTGESGLGGPAAQAVLGSPESVATDATGNVLMSEPLSSRVVMLANSTGTFYGQAMTAGDVYSIAGTGVAGYSGNGGLATAAKLSGVQGIAVDSHGNAIIPDWGNNRIRVVAASTGTFYGQAMTVGHIYSIVGTGRGGFGGDGEPVADAVIHAPTAVVTDSAGDVLISDSLNNRIRMVAARTGTFYGQAMTAGDIYTIAGNGKSSNASGDGGPATKAELASPLGLALDGAGNLVISDSFNNRVRVVAASTGEFYGQAMTAGYIYTVAGGGTTVGNGGPATSAQLTIPGQVAVDSTGNLIITDGYQNQIRVVAAVTGTFYGVAMTAGDIYDVAGDGVAGFAGNGGPATSAELGTESVAVTPGGDLVTGDTHRLLEITG